MPQRYVQMQLSVHAAMNSDIDTVFEVASTWCGSAYSPLSHMFH
jgi:hypothetical protein